MSILQIIICVKDGVQSAPFCLHYISGFSTCQDFSLKFVDVNKKIGLDMLYIAKLLKINTIKNNRIAVQLTDQARNDRAAKHYVYSAGFVITDLLYHLQLKN